MTITQLLRSRIAFTSASTRGGAEAVSAINGAGVSALSPPSCRNDVLNFSPLF